MSVLTTAGEAERKFAESNSPSIARTDLPNEVKICILLNRAGFRRPFQSHTVVTQQFLKVREQFFFVPHFARCFFLRVTKCRERAGGLADVPFHRMQPVAAVR